MPSTEINNSVVGANRTYITDYSVDSKNTDAATGQEEYYWQNTRWSQQFGYYSSVEELKMAIDAKAMWTVGKGFTADPITTLALSVIRGSGRDTFNSILENMLRVAEIGGDSFAEIIRDDGGRLVNIKPLDPGTVKVVANSSGLIIRYEQCSKNPKNSGVKEFKPEEVFHIVNNRVADSIHGTSTVDSVEWIILALKEAMTDYKTVLHRNVYPVRIWTLDTDVPSEILAFKNKVATAKGTYEDIFIPKGAVETELASVPENSSLNPMSWIAMLTGKFYKTVGCPEIIIGGSQELTQTAAQIAYLAFEQVVEQKQLNVEEQVLSQLGLEIELSFPASLQNNLLSDAAKDGTQEQQQNQASILQPPLQRGAL